MPKKQQFNKRDIQSKLRSLGFSVTDDHIKVVLDADNPEYMMLRAREELTLRPHPKNIRLALQLLILWLLVVEGPEK